MFSPQVSSASIVLHALVSLKPSVHFCLISQQAPSSAALVQRSPAQGVSSAAVLWTRLTSQSPLGLPVFANLQVWLVITPTFCPASSAERIAYTRSSFTHPKS